MNRAVCKTAWSHGIFVITFCQITRASVHWFCLEKRKGSPTWAIPPCFPGRTCSQHVPRASPSTFAALAVAPLSGWGAGAPEVAKPRAGFQQQFCLCSFSLSLLAAPRCCPLQPGPPMASVPQGCPHLSLAPSVVSSPWRGSPAAPGVQQHTPFTTAFSQLCFQMFPAADGSFQVLPLWGHCSPPAVLG